MAIENKNMVVVHFRDVQINKVYNNFEIGRLVFSKFYILTISDKFLLYTDIFFNFSTFSITLIMFRLEFQVIGMNMIRKYKNTAKFFCFSIFVKFSLNKSHKRKNGKDLMTRLYE